MFVWDSLTGGFSLQYFEMTAKWSIMQNENYSMWRTILYNMESKAMDKCGSSELWPKMIKTDTNYIHNAISFKTGERDCVA